MLLWATVAIEVIVALPKIIAAIRDASKELRGEGDKIDQTKIYDPVKETIKEKSVNKTKGTGDGSNKYV